MQVPRSFRDLIGAGTLGEILEINTDGEMARLDETFTIMQNRMVAMPAAHFHALAQGRRTVDKIAMVPQGLETDQVIGKQAIEKFFTPG